LSGQTRRAYISCINGRSVSVEGAIGIGNVQVAFLGGIGDDIDCPSQCISAQTYGHYPFVYFYAFRNIDRNVVELKGRTKIFHWDTINEEFYLFAGKAV